MPPSSPTEDHLRDGPARDAKDSTDNLQPPRDTGARHRRRTAIPALSLAAGLVFFFGPATAFVLGDRARPIENHPLAAMPPLNSGAATIQGLKAWTVDHLPLRSQAVRADTDLSEALFGEPPSAGNHTTPGAGSVAAGSPSPDSAGAKPSNPDAVHVIQGKDGWLYIDDDFKSACDPKLGLPTVIDGLKRLHTAVEASGRKLVISVIPDKSTGVPQNLPENFAFKNCGEEHQREFWRDIVASNVPFVDLREPLAAAERAARHPMYLKLNTHWTMQGFAVWTKSVLAALDRRLIDGVTIPGVDASTPSNESPFVAGPVIDVLGDLTFLLGAPRTEPMPQINLRRKGVTLSLNGVPLPGSELTGQTVTQAADATGLNVPPPLVRGGQEGTPVTTEASTTAAPLYPGHTLILGDSFYDLWRWLFAPFISRLTAVHVMADGAKITPSIIDADTVVLEVVERSLSSGSVPLLRPDALTALEKSLAAHHR